MQPGKTNCPATRYAPDQLKYQSSKLVAVYAVKTVGIAPECFGGLQVDLIALYVRFVTYNNTYKYIVFFVYKDTTYNENTNNVYIWTL